jgi:hypothetical protein
VDATMKYEVFENIDDRERIMDFLTSHINRFIDAKDAYQDRSKTKFRRNLSYLLFWTGKYVIFEAKGAQISIQKSLMPLKYINLVKYESFYRILLFSFFIILV